MDGSCDEADEGFAGVEVSGGGVLGGNSFICVCVDWEVVAVCCIDL